jgi:hypothetical protein
VSALDGHDPGRGVCHKQAWISLQASLAVALSTCSDAGVTSNAFAIVRNHEMIHGSTITCEFQLNFYLHENGVSVIG